MHHLVCPLPVPLTATSHVCCPLHAPLRCALVTARVASPCTLPPHAPPCPPLITTCAALPCISQSHAPLCHAYHSHLHCPPHHARLSCPHHPPCLSRPRHPPHHYYALTTKTPISHFYDLSLNLFLSGLVWLQICYAEVQSSMIDGYLAFQKVRYLF